MGRLSTPVNSLCAGLCGIECTRGHYQSAQFASTDIGVYESNRNTTLGKQRACALCEGVESYKIGTQGWRDGSVVKSTGCSSRGPQFNSQHPHGSSQLSVTPASGDPTPSDIHAGKTPVQMSTSLFSCSQWMGKGLFCCKSSQLL